MPGELEACEVCGSYTCFVGHKREARMDEPKGISDEDIEHTWGRAKFCSRCGGLSARERPRCRECDINFARALLALAAERMVDLMHQHDGTPCDDCAEGERIAAEIRRVLMGGKA